VPSGLVLGARRFGFHVKRFKGAIDRRGGLAVRRSSAVNSALRPVRRGAFQTRSIEIDNVPALKDRLSGRSFGSMGPPDALIRRVTNFGLLASQPLTRVTPKLTAWHSNPGSATANRVDPQCCGPRRVVVPLLR
jgi:hypothetical protein